MRIGDILAFNKKSYFNGAIQAEWFYDKRLAGDIAASYVFHGPRYYGVSSQDVQSGQHLLMDTVSYTSMIAGHISSGQANSFIMTIAGYGTGKSHLAVTLGALFSGHDQSRRLILENIKSVEYTKGEEIAAELGDARTLVIALNGMNNFNLDHEVLTCARKALQQHGLDGDMLREITKAYSLAHHFLSQTFNMLSARYGFYAERYGVNCAADALFETLEHSLDRDKNAFQVVNEVYREINGSFIQWENGISAGEVLSFLHKKLVIEEKHFRKILILFDEFGRYIEYAAHNPVVAGESALQQVFEAVQNSRGGIVHVAFIQSELSAYLSRIDRTASIIRYVGRYDASDKYYLSSNFETILANLIQKKDEPAFRKFVVGPFNRLQGYYQDMLSALNRWAKSSQKKSVWSDRSMFLDVICKGCYPLHPITVWMLANMASWMQQRSTLTFAENMFAQMGGSRFNEDSDFLPCVRPSDIIESQVFNEMVNSEEKGLVQSQYCLLYKEILTKIGDNLSREERTVLNGILITNIGRFECSDYADAVLAVRHCSCLREDSVKRAIHSLENIHGVISFSEITKRFNMYAETNGMNDYTRVLLRRRIAFGNKLAIEDADELIRVNWGLSRPVETPFARVHNISGSEWCFEKRLIGYENFRSAAPTLSKALDAAYDGEQARGMILMVYTPEDPRSIASDMCRLYNEYGFGSKAFIVMILSDPEKSLIDDMTQYKVLQTFSENEAQRFGRFIDAQRKSFMTRLIQRFEALQREKYIVTRHGLVNSNARLNQLCADRFEECFTKPLPFNFDGFEKRITPTIRRYFNEVASNIAGGTLLSKSSFDLLQQDVRNRLNGLLSDASARSWGMLSEDHQLHLPTNTAVSDMFIEIKGILDDEQPHSLYELLGKYLCEPYGMSQYGLALLIVAFIGFYGSGLDLYSGTDKVHPVQMVQTVFTGSKLQLAVLFKFSLQVCAQSAGDAVRELCGQINANRYVENCADLGNKLETLLQGGRLPLELDGIIASAKLKIKDGKRLYKAIYLRLEEAQACHKEAAAKLMLNKAVQVFSKLERYVGAIEESGPYVFSDAYAAQCDACLSATNRLLRERGMDAVAKINFDITQIAQYRSAYKKISEILAANGHEALAQSIDERILSVENDLIVAQKYESRIKDCEWFLSTTKVDADTIYMDCVRVRQQAENWMRFWNDALDLSSSQKAIYLKKLGDLMAACERKIEDMRQRLQDLVSAESTASNEAGLERVRKGLLSIRRYELQGEQQETIQRIQTEIDRYDAFWNGLTVTRANFDETTARIDLELSSHPYHEIALDRMAKIDSMLQRQSKDWMQQNVAAYARKIHRLPVHEAIQVQRILEVVPDFLDRESLSNIEMYREMVAERIRLARVEAIELLFKDLDPEEKLKCLEKLKLIVDKNIKKAGTLGSNSKNPSFTEEELIILLYFYIKYKDEWFSASAPHVNDLSRLYRDLPIHSMEDRLSPTFRNPAGIDLQLRSMAKCDPDNGHNQKLTPSLDMYRVWDELSSRGNEVSQLFEDILQKYHIDRRLYPSLAASIGHTM